MKKTKKIMTIALALAMSASIINVPVANATAVIPEEGIWIDDFSGFTTDKTVAPGWVAHYPGKDYLNGVELMVSTSRTDNDSLINRGIFTKLSWNNNFETYAVQNFDTAYTSGYLNISYDINAWALNNGSMVWTGFLQDKTSLAVSGITDRVETMYSKIADVANQGNRIWSAPYNYSSIRQLMNFGSVANDDGEYEINYLYNVPNENNENGLRHSGNGGSEKDIIDPKTWYTVNSFIDLEKQTVTTYLDGTPIYQDLYLDGANVGVQGLFFTYQPGKSNYWDSFYVDNVSVRHSNSPITDVVAKAVNEGKVATDGGKISLVYSEALTRPLTKDLITISDAQGNVVTDYTITSTVKNADITFSSLNHDTTYSIEYSDLVTGVSSKPVSATMFKTGAKQSRKYLAYENFETTETGKIPANLYSKDWENAGTKIDTSVNGLDNSKAIKLSSEDIEFNLYTLLSEKVVGIAGSDDAITVEFDMKSTNGGMFVNMFTEANADVTNSWTKNTRVFGFGPTTEASAYMMRTYCPQSYNDLSTKYSSYSKNYEFTNFGEWVHCKLELDMPAVNAATPALKYGSMVMTVTKADGTSYKGSDYNFMADQAGRTYNPQTDIAGIGFGVYPTTEGISPVLELDNVEIYLTNNTTTVDAPKVKGVTFNGENDVPDVINTIEIEFDKAMQDNTDGYITLKNGNEVVETTGTPSEDGLVYTITPVTPMKASTEYTLYVSGNALSAEGGLIEGAYTKLFTTKAGEIKVNSITLSNANTYHLPEVNW